MIRRQIFYIIAIVSFLIILSAMAACHNKRLLAPSPTTGLIEAPLPLRPFLNALENPALNHKNKDAADQVRAMIANYAPRIWWHPSERFGPMDPMRFLSGSSLWIHHRWRPDECIVNRGKIIPGELGLFGQGLYRQKNGRAPSGENISRGEENSFYLRMEDAFTTPIEEKVPIFWKLGRNSIVQKLGKNALGHFRIVIEYWYHVAYNQATDYIIGNHQGDWEGLAQVIDISVDQISSQLNHKLIMSFLAAHELGLWQCASDLEYEQKHPVIYSALGTHATYSRPGAHKATFITDQTAKGRRWDTWNFIRPLALEPYFGYAGAWGDLNIFSFMSGPAAPGPFKVLPKRDEEFSNKELPLLSRCPM